MKKTLFLNAMVLATVQAFAGTDSTISVVSTNSPYNLDTALAADGKITLTMATGTAVKNASVSRGLTSVQIGEMTLAKEAGADAPEVTVEVAANTQYGILNRSYNNAALTFNGGTINKKGTGTFIVVNTHVDATDSGAINVQAGTLQFAKPGDSTQKEYSFEGSTVDVNVSTGATVNIAGTKVALNSLTLNSGGRLLITANTVVTGTVTGANGSEIMFNSDQYGNYIANGSFISDKLTVADTFKGEVGITGGSTSSVVNLNNAVNGRLTLVGAIGKIVGEVDETDGSTQIISTDLALGNTTSANEWHITGGESYKFTGTLSNYKSDNAGNFVFNGDIAASNETIKEVAVTFTGDMSAWTSNGETWGGLRAVSGASVNVTISGEIDSNVMNAFNADAVTRGNENGYMYLTLDRSATLKGLIRINGLTVNSGKNVITEDAGVVVKNAITVQDGASLTMAVNAAKTTEELTLGSGAKLTLGSDVSHNNNLNVTSSLTVEGNSVLNANLVVSGGTITFNDNAVLTMGCDVTIGQGDMVTVVLTDTMVEQIAAGNHVVLFENVDSDKLGSSITFAGNLLAPADVYSLKYDAGNKTIYVTPEPATATLSLLALAGLCARRRRH